MENMDNVLRSARRVAVPIVSIRSYDPGITIKNTIPIINPKNNTPIIKWDIVNGFIAYNELGINALTAVPDVESCSDLTVALDACTKLPNNTVVFIQWPHKFIEMPQVSQAIYNLRDIYKSTNRMLILLSPELITIPELMGSTVNINESLPTDNELRTIVLTEYKTVGIQPISEDYIEQCIVNLRGLTSFEAEQLTALAMTREGVNVDLLSKIVENAISNVPGLKVIQNDLSLSDIGGLNQVKSYINMLFRGRKPPSVVVHIDELEKSIGGYSATGGGDNTGVSADQLATLLAKMEDYEWEGFIFVGAPGTGKSFVAKLIGPTYGVSTIALDLGAMKTSLLGASEGRIRYALDIIQNRAAGKVLVVATANGLSKVPPELRRRFTFGIVYFDLPDEDERKSIWEINKRRFGLDVEETVPTEFSYTGADIRNMCKFASNTGTSLLQAARFNVPIAKSDPDIIKTLREQADMRYLSASYPGEYRLKGVTGDKL